MSADVHGLSGAYAVDALDEREREAFESHLAQCAECQAEEVAQEAFLEIWRQSARFDPRVGSPMGWMLTIAHGKAVDRVRSAQAATHREDSYGARTQERSFDTTSDQVESRLDAQRVRRALDALTDTQRGAVELAYLGGYTHTEVAGLLGVPLGTAKTRIRDGLIRLRDTLGVQS